MPEEDLETGDLKEQIDQRLEEHEHGHGHGHSEGHGHGEGHAKPQVAAWVRYLSLSTAIIAVFAAVASLLSGSSSNEAILEKSEAMLRQSEASDQWAYYQAKSVKQKLSEDEAAIVKDTRPELYARFAADAQRYDTETKKIEDKARELERQVVESNEASKALMERHHRFAISVTLLQIAIALSAIAALTRRRSLWYVGLGGSVAGGVMFVLGLMAS
jgi:gas vesicle protein